MATILVVDDDEVDRELATRCLASLDDLEVLYARQGLEALELIETRDPDLVLTDLRMPVMDGLALVEKAGETHPLLPVILMTARGSERIAVEALEAGAASYVPKGEMKGMLADTVEQVLEVAASRRSRSEVVRYLGHSETEFLLDNDPTLIAPLVGYFQESLERLGWGREAVRTQVGVAIMEAVSNAMVHGNLEVGSGLRRADRPAYERLVRERREEAPYAARRVRCSSRESTERVKYVVEDEGPGFDPSGLPDPTTPENLLEVSGRGIMLIRTFMDEVEFNERGNCITMAKSRAKT